MKKNHFESDKKKITWLFLIIRALLLSEVLFDLIAAVGDRENGTV